MKKYKSFFLFTALGLTSTSLHADSSFFVAPGFRGQANTEYAGWESFTVAYNGPNAPHLPGTTGHGVLTQTGSPGAFLTGAPGAQNIYGFTGVVSFNLVDATPYTLGQVVLQLRNAAGSTPFDYASVGLQYDNGGGLQTLSAPRLELNNTSGGVASLWNWDVSSLGINSYTLLFTASGQHLSLDALALDTKAVPEPSTWALLGMGAMGWVFFQRRKKAVTL